MIGRNFQIKMNEQNPARPRHPPTKQQTIYIIRELPKNVRHLNLQLTRAEIFKVFIDDEYVLMYNFFRCGVAYLDNAGFDKVNNT